MLDYRSRRKLFKAMETGFFTLQTFIDHLADCPENATDVIADLELQGYIEKTSAIPGTWTLSTRGKLDLAKKRRKLYRISTMQKHLSDMIQRAQEINASNKHTHFIQHLQVVSQFPIIARSEGVFVLFSLKLREISREEYDSRSNELRVLKARPFNNYAEYATYSQLVIGKLLKASSHVLKLEQVNETTDGDGIVYQFCNDG